jgi:hypothetical protein
VSTDTADFEEGVNMGRLVGIIVMGIVLAVGTFAVTFSLLATLGAYLATVCGVYALLWVTGHV